MIDLSALSPHCPPANATDISAAEEALTVTLPDSYKAFVMEKNGVYLSAIHPIKNYPEELSKWLADGFVPVFDILGVNKIEHLNNNFEINELIDEWGVEGEKVNTSGIFQSGYLINEWGLPKDIVLLSGNGHTWIALDYREASIDPPVIFIESETCHWCKIADNFDAFFKGLVEELDD